MIKAEKISVIAKIYGNDKLLWESNPIKEKCIMKDINSYITSLSSITISFCNKI